MSMSEFEKSDVDGGLARKLQADVAKLRLDTFHNVESAMRENINSYKAQISALQESNDRLEKSRDSALTRIKDVELRYHQALVDMQNLKTSNLTQLASLEAELKLKRFESKRTSGILTEAQQRLSIMHNENTKILTHLDDLKEDRIKNEMIYQCELNTLRMLLQEKASKLEVYETMESNIDTLIFNSAKGKEEGEAQIFATLGGGNLPINIKRRIKYSMDLAGRIVELERECNDLKNELFLQRDLNSVLRSKLDSKEDIVKNAGLPVSDLLKLLEKRDDEITRLRKEDESLNALAGPLESGDVGKILKILKGLLMSRKEGRKNWDERRQFQKICKEVGYSNGGGDVSVSRTPSKEDIQKLMDYVSSRPLGRFKLQDEFMTSKSSNSQSQ